MTFHLLLAGVFLCCNIFFVLAEFALVKAQRSRLEVMRADGRRRATLVIGMMDNLDNYLSAIQIGVTMSTLALGWAGEPVMARLVDNLFDWPSFLASHAGKLNTTIAFCFIIYIQIVFAELVPRSIAIQKAETIALWVAIPLTGFYKVLRAPIIVMAKSSKFVSRLIGLKPVAEHQEVFNEDEVRVLMGLSQEKGLMPLDRLLLIENLFDLEHLKVRDAMVPRDKIISLSTAYTWDENRRTLETNHFSRYPLGDPDIERIRSYVHVKDLALNGAGIPDIARIARPIAIVDENAPLPPLLKTMTTQGKHMMLVTKAGKTTGLITLEDVIEELLGEIHDEFDALSAWWLHPLLSIDAIDLDLPGGAPQDAVRALASKLKTSNPELDVKSVESLVMAREFHLSTAIGKGVAVPHARLAAIKRPLLAVGRTKQSFSFLTPDKTPVRLVVLILTPASAPLEQLRILARVATLAKNETLLRQLIRTKTPAQFLETVRTSEPILIG